MISELIHINSDGEHADIDYNENVFKEKPYIYYDGNDVYVLDIELKDNYKLLPERTTIMFKSDEFIYATFDDYENMGFHFYDNIGNPTNLMEKNADMFITLYFKTQSLK